MTFTLINNGTAYSVSKGTFTGAEVVIPAVHNGLPVIEVADSGFSSYANLTSIIIPTGVTRIGNHAFFLCGNLASIVIPEALLNIGNAAFQDCGSFTTVFYGGADNAAWNKITIGSGNTPLTEAARYYYLGINAVAVTGGSFWRFTDNVPMLYHTVVFNSNEGSTVTDQILEHGEAAERPANPTRSSYFFLGWYADSGLTILFNFSATVNSSIMLYAKWTELITSVSGIDLVWIYPGTFTQGSPASEPYGNAKPQREVTISKGFYMGIYEVTQEQYLTVTGENPSYFHGGSGMEPVAGEVQGRRPVEMVAWYDAVEFCNKLSEMEGLTPAYTITNRYPTTGYPIGNAEVTIN